MPQVCNFFGQTFAYFVAAMSVFHTEKNKFTRKILLQRTALLRALNMTQHSVAVPEWETDYFKHNAAECRFLYDTVSKKQGHVLLGFKTSVI